MKTIRIFISSPGDVAEERDKARKVVESLQKRYAERLQLETVLWEDLPLGAVDSFQGGIDIVLKGEKAIDIAVFILWSRLGSPLGKTIRKSDGSEYRSGTEREFELMLAARAESQDNRPEILVYIRQNDRHFKASLLEKPTDEIEEMLHQYKMAEQFIREQFRDTETGSNLRAYHTFPEPNTFANRLKTHLRNLLDTIAFDGGLGFGSWEGSPYRGLEVFRAEHAPIFFGRDEEICEALERLRAQAEAGCAFLLLVGASGSGKSSLAQAGVLPLLETDNLDESVTEWRTAVLTPGEFADRLCGGLAQTLLACIPALHSDHESLADIEQALRMGPNKGFTLLLRRTCQERNDQRGTMRLILLVDQLEELFTHPAIKEKEIDTFFAALHALAVSGCVWIMATVRSDFYDRCQCYPILMAMKGERGQMDVLPPEPSDIHRIITGPAMLAGVTFEKNASGESLDQRILNDVIAHPEAMPLLEFALSQLYASRTSKNILSFHTYQQFGGIEGAIGHHAEKVFTHLNDAAKKAVMTLIPLLVQRNWTLADKYVRRHCLAHEYIAINGAEEAIDALVKARLLIRDHAADDTPIIYVSHEALFTKWSRARQILLEAKADIEKRSYLMDEAERWLQSGKRCDYLLPKDRFPLVDAIARTTVYSLSSTVLEYIHASERVIFAKIDWRTWWQVVWYYIALIFINISFCIDNTFSWFILFLYLLGINLLFQLIGSVLTFELLQSYFLVTRSYHYFRRYLFYFSEGLILFLLAILAFILRTYLNDTYAFIMVFCCSSGVVFLGMGVYAHIQFRKIPIQLRHDFREDKKRIWRTFRLMLLLFLTISFVASILTASICVLVR